MKLRGTLCMLLWFLPADDLRANGLMGLSALCRRMAHHHVLLSFILGLFLILLLLLLYVRQRQRVYLAKLDQIVSEQKRQYLILQKDTERRLTRKYIDGLESERERIARELHDDVCNHLLAFEMKIRSLPEKTCEAVEEQLELLKTVRERLRNISHELMPPAFQYATIDEMLSDYIGHLSLPKRMAAEYRSTKETDWEQVPQEIGFELYRIVQEAVGNAVKYAEATCIRVELSLEGKRLSLLVADNGKGFDSYRKMKGVGLRTIRKRTELIGGEMELDTTRGTGMRVSVNL